ncbi:hypothetical protein Pan258_40180 [Symmachiella dynata]|uniref:Uncharacterized protein n=1 Tax=Symmachiella dynata TaxID=2527995 RepID=A0A517ZT95_9PLAN|nr:hypothetical protein Pan258_40180 [Symmachiella dynata]QDU45680.1 hypothetical protein Mal52_41750 [Symmachiella dynata]
MATHPCFSHFSKAKNDHRAAVRTFLVVEFAEFDRFAGKFLFPTIGIADRIRQFLPPWRGDCRMTFVIGMNVGDDLPFRVKST